MGRGCGRELTSSDRRHGACNSAQQAFSSGLNIRPPRKRPLDRDAIGCAFRRHEQKARDRDNAQQRPRVSAHMIFPIRKLSDAMSRLIGVVGKSRTDFCHPMLDRRGLLFGCKSG